MTCLSAVEEGGVFGIIGANGAGKTTLFNIISGAIKPDAGIVRFAGVDITGQTPSRLCVAGIGRTFQIARPFPDLTVLETIRVAVLCRVHAMRAATDRARRDRAPVRPCDKSSIAADDISACWSESVLSWRELMLPDRACCCWTRSQRAFVRAKWTSLSISFAAVASENITVLMIEHVLAAVFALGQARGRARPRQNDRRWHAASHCGRS